MTLQFHPAVQHDFNHAIAHYEVEGSGHLAERFETEFRWRTKTSGQELRHEAPVSIPDLTSLPILKHGDEIRLLSRNAKSRKRDLPGHGNEIER